MAIDSSDQNSEDIGPSTPWIFRLPSKIGDSAKNLAKWFAGLTTVRRLGTWVASLVSTVGPKARLLVLTRASGLVIVLMVVILFMVPQGRELTADLRRSPSHTLYFFLAVAALAIQSWYWARTILLYDATLPVKERGWLFTNLPRLYGTAAIALAAISISLTSAGLDDALIWGTVAASLAFYIFSILRRKMFAPAAPARQDMWLQIMIGMSCLAVLGFSGWAVWKPVGMGFRLGSATVVFLAFALVIPVATGLVHLGRKAGIPMVSALLLWAIAISPLTDNHMVRTTAIEAPARVAVPDAYQDWSRAKPQAADSYRNLIVIATAGGGLRAAYWTATVLGRASDRAPGFDQDIFAMSGVSGGSLGLALYNTVLIAGARDCAGLAESGGDSCYESKMQYMLSHDFLGPTVVATMFQDGFQRLIPGTWFADRAFALEAAWETAWSNTYPNNKKSLFAVSFHSLWPPRGSEGEWLPALLLNGTHQQTGKRIVTSNLLIEQAIFPDTLDFFEWYNCSIRVSTAALNSARFSYVSPAGTLNQDGCTEHHMGHIIDGGYFENFGAETLHQLLNHIQRSDRDGTGLMHSYGKVRPIVIQISNDVGAALDTFADIDAATPADEFPGDMNGFKRFMSLRFANEIRAPVEGIFATRNGRGILAAKTLRGWVTDYNADRDELDPGRALYVHFRLMKRPGKPVPALGWALSRESRDEIKDQLGDVNPCQLGLLLKALGDSAAVPKSGECQVAEDLGLVVR